MRDEFDDRIYQALRHDFGKNVTAIARSITHAFDRLEVRLYGAPWSRETNADKPRRETRLTAR